MDGPFGRRLAENIPSGRIAVPLLLGQGLSDQLVLPSVQQEFVNARCAAGQTLTYMTVAGKDHLGLVLPTRRTSPSYWPGPEIGSQPGP